MDEDNLILRKPYYTESKILENKGIRACTLEVVVYNNVFVGFINYRITSKHVIKIEQFQIFDIFKRKGIGTKAILYFKQKNKDFSFYGTVLYPIAYEFWNSLINNYNLNMELDFNIDDVTYISYE